MSYKEEIKSKVEAIVAKGHDVDAKIIETVKTDFVKTLATAKKSGISLKTATYETLEGIEEGLKASGHKTEDILKKSANAMVEVTKKSSEEAIAKSKEIAQKSKDTLDSEINKTKEGIEKVNDTVKNKMQTSYTDFHAKVSSEKEHLQDISEGIKEYSVEKSHHLLSSSVDKTKEAIHQLDTSFKEHSTALLEHTKESASSWYQSLKNKIHKY